MIRLFVPVTTAMTRIELDSARVQVAEENPVTTREDLSELGQLLSARGADAAWAILDDTDGSIASWLALTVVALDGTSPGAVRRRARHADPIEMDEEIRETVLGPALRLRQRVVVPAPMPGGAAGAIVTESLDWSWILPDEMMLSVNTNTSQLVYADWVTDQVDRVAQDIALVR